LRLLPASLHDGHLSLGGLLVLREFHERALTGAVGHSTLGRKCLHKSMRVCEYTVRRK
jgi:hypothetical protein